ncbi:MAG TPA: hypothetical protein VFD43_04965 [Planctomycetota bacterium]|nr:hypothetical protein [Planctomycetota bacterium]
MSAPRPRLLVWLALWSGAFGLAEGAVVVYLRRLCYPGQPDDGPLFPLPVVDPLILRTEMAREAATLAMLLGVAMLSERRPLRRFAAFAFCFGVWDLVYYATLHALLGWPAGLLEWDVLFLIPAPWSSPVLAPVLVSVALVGSSALVLRRIDEAAVNPFRLGDWLAQTVCGALIVWSMLWNAATVERQEPPGDYPWWLFLAGLLGGIALFWRALRRAR